LFITERPMAFNTMMPTMANATNTVAMINHIMLNCFLGLSLFPQQSYQFRCHSISNSCF
jgi:hypothetical protein